MIDYYQTPFRYCFGIPHITTQQLSEVQSHNALRWAGTRESFTSHLPVSAGSPATICLVGYLTQLWCFCQWGTHYFTRVSILLLLANSFWYWEEICPPATIGLALYPRATEHVYILFHTAALNLPGNGVICVPLAFLSKQSIVLRHHDFQTGPIQAASISPPFHFQYVTPKVKQNTLLRLPSRDC